MNHPRTEEYITGLRLWPAAYVPLSMAWHAQANAAEDRWLIDRFANVTAQHFPNAEEWKILPRAIRFNRLHSYVQELATSVGIGQVLFEEFTPVRDSVLGGALGIINRVSLNSAVLDGDSLEEIRETLTHEVTHLWQTHRVFQGAHAPKEATLEAVCNQLLEKAGRLKWETADVQKRFQFLREEAVPAIMTKVFGHRSAVVRDFVGSFTFEHQLHRMIEHPNLREVLTLLGGAFSSAEVLTEGIRKPSFLWSAPSDWRTAIWGRNLSHYFEGSFSADRKGGSAAYFAQGIERHARESVTQGLRFRLLEKKAGNTLVDSALRISGRSSFLAGLHTVSAVSVPLLFLGFDAYRLMQRLQSNQTTSAAFQWDCGGLMASCVSVLSSFGMLTSVSRAGRLAMGAHEHAIPAQEICFGPSHFGRSQKWARVAGVSAAVAATMTAIASVCDIFSDPESTNLQKTYSVINAGFCGAMGVFLLRPRENRLALAMSLAAPLIFSWGQSQHYEFPQSLQVLDGRSTLPPKLSLKPPLPLWERVGERGKQISPSP